LEGLWWRTSMDGTRSITLCEFLHLDKWETNSELRILVILNNRICDEYWIELEQIWNNGGLLWTRWWTIEWVKPRKIFLKNYQLLRQSLYFEVCLLIPLSVLLVNLALYNELGIEFATRVCSFVSYVRTNLKFPIPVNNFSYQLVLIRLFPLLLINYFLEWSYSCS
jgi:hypothetical protein